MRGARWFAGAIAACVGAAVVLAMSPANAAPKPVTATFGLTGVTGSNCDTGTGGTALYLPPGADLDAKTSLAGVKLLGLDLTILTGAVAGLNGTLTIDGTSHQITTGKVADISGLSKGDHSYVFTADTVGTTLGANLPLSLSSTAIAAGLKLTWKGVIHVTKDAAKCGVSVSLPGVGASASVTGLPPVHVSLPPVNGPTVSVPGLPGLPGGGNGQHSSGGHQHHASPPPGLHYTPPPETVPQRVVPHPHRGAGGVGIALPPLAPAPSVGGVAPVSARSSDAANSAAPVPATTRPAKTVDVAAKKELGGAQLPVLLAILAIVSLSIVTALYARRYLLRHRA